MVVDTCYLSILEAKAGAWGAQAGLYIETLSVNDKTKINKRRGRELGLEEEIAKPSKYLTSILKTLGLIPSMA